MEQADSTEFRRVLGPWSAGALIAGSIIGTGIFIFVSGVAGRLPSRPAIIVAWTLGAMVASCGALCLAELAAAYPQTGGIYVFLRRSYGPAVAFMYSWAKFLIMRPGSLGIMAVAFAGFCAAFIGVGSVANPWVERAIAIGSVLVLTGINVVGVRTGAVVQNVLTAVKILCLMAIIVVAGAFAVGVLSAHPVEVEPAEPPTGSFVVLFGAALIAIMWTFGGWDESPFVAEEVRNPERNLPLSILGGLWIAALLFVLVNAAYLAILSPAEMAGSGIRTAPLAMERAVGGGANKALTLALMISTFGAANGLALTGGRIAYATGRDQPLFRWFASTSPRTKTPIRSLSFQAVLTIAAILVFGNPLKLLFYTGLAYWLFAGLSAGAVVILRGREPDRKRPFRVWGYPVLPALFIVACGVMGVSVIVTDRPNAIVTVCILAVGAVAYFIQSRVWPAAGGGSGRER
ncbi:MAG: amino acid permease [Phycisphaerales bacterium]|nr:MAG: amino acid permease [Phycisphaerales bacterium]